MMEKPVESRWYPRTKRYTRGNSRYAELQQRKCGRVVSALEARLVLVNSEVSKYVTAIVWMCRTKTQITAGIKKAIYIVGVRAASKHG